VSNEEKYDEICARLEHSPQIPCIGDWGFKIISVNCHKIHETEITEDKCSA
jgi:hypothetical protein